ncbi:MAG: hypothetical protein JRI85_14765 [Deltaproteobacteria bacterium]|nr:hypothetical protein [Deltaproteobacteria bacterium]
MKLFFGKQLDIVEKIEISVAYLLSLSLVFVILRALFYQQWTLLFISTITLLLFYLPVFIARRLRIHLPVEMEFVIVLFIYAALFLGEIGNYYVTFWWWDLLMHTFSGVGFGFMGFIILYTLYTYQRVETSPTLIALFSFCFAVAIGAVWEIFEFSMDNVWGLNMQKSGLVDTMTDLIINSIGAFLTSLTGFLYIRGERNQLFARLIRKFIEKNPQFFRPDSRL